MAEAAQQLKPRSEHLRSVDAPRRGAQFAAVDHDVARILGPQRGPSLIYGFLATAWYEFASPEKLAEIKKKTGRTITPGDWTEASYTQFMSIAGTRSKDSISRWLSALAEDVYPCPWARCGDEHPLIAIDRQGCNRNNRYRKWQCGSDELVPRRKIRSEKLRARANERVLRNREPDAIASAAIDDPGSPMIGLPLDAPPDFRKSDPRTTGSPDAGNPEVRSPAFQSSDDRTSLRANKENTDSVGSIKRTAAQNNGPAEVEQASEVDAVACEIVEAVLALAQRVEPEYTDGQAWIVSRRLATVVLGVTGEDAAAARTALLAAIADRRLMRAERPIGLLIRGIAGDRNGDDRYLLNVKAAAEAVPHRDSSPAPSLSALPPGLQEALVAAVQSGAATEAWLRERGISIHARDEAQRSLDTTTSPASATPLCDALAAADPVAYQHALTETLASLEVTGFLAERRSLENPMFLGMSRSRLEARLATEPPEA